MVHHLTQNPCVIHKRTRYEAVIKQRKSTAKDGRLLLNGSVLNIPRENVFIAELDSLVKMIDRERASRSLSSPCRFQSPRNVPILHQLNRRPRLLLIFGMTDDQRQPSEDCLIPTVE